MIDTLYGGDEMDIRWKQRFQNFSRAYSLLAHALGLRSIEELSINNKGE
jgi:predicted Zn-dependent protease